jgi:hypothetical protein
MMVQTPPLTSQRVQALVMTTGLFTFVSVGMVACIALIITVFYLLAEFILLMLQAIIEVFSTIAHTWVTADPFLRLLILAAVVYGAYRLYQFKKGKTHHA